MTRISELTIPYVAASGRPHHACGPLDGYEIHLGRTVPEAVAPLSMPLVDADYGSRAERDVACRLMAASSAHTFDWLLEDSSLRGDELVESVRDNVNVAAIGRMSGLPYVRGLE